MHKSSHTAGAREVGLMGAMASCAPPNTLLIAAPTPRPCPAPTPLSTAATQPLAGKLEVDEIRRLKQRGYDRKYKAKLKAKNQKNEYRRLKKNAYQREYDRKAAAKKKELKRMLPNANHEQAARKVENKKPRTVSYSASGVGSMQREHARSSQPLARQTAASRRTGIRSITIRVD